MGFSDLLTLFGGLALFLYGMKMMSDGLEAAAGDKMQAILQKLTSNRILAIVAGAVITAVIQSSAATTIMTLGFVNAGMMTLYQAVWIIMGANIGTTITGQLIALDIGAFAPFFAFLGVIMVTFIKNNRVNCVGEIIAGLGILFIGMDTMGAAMIPLRESAVFINFITTIENPFFAVLVGALFTAAIQSSSASIGVIQALAGTGAITLASSSNILFGTNIGSCITSFLASLSANRNAKRTTLVHLLFNLIGTALFMTLCAFTPIVSWIEALTPTAPMAQIANLHTLFNITTTLVLLPFGKQLADLAILLLPIRESEKEESMELIYINQLNIGSYAVAISQLNKEVIRMCKLAHKGIDRTLRAIVYGDKFDFEKIHKNEDKINYLTMEITDFMAKVSKAELSSQESAKCNAYFKISSDIERIGDHAINISEFVELMVKEEIKLDKTIKNEISEIYQVLNDFFKCIMTQVIFESDEAMKMALDFEQKVDDLTFAYRQNQIERLKNNHCDAKTSVFYSELLINLERVADHLMNIAEECQNVEISFVDEQI